MQYFGKYRGKVTNNVDPEQLGRLQVSAPAVLGDGRLSWALPCAPVAGPGTGFFAVPPIGANVWVEFEGGDPNSPIWAGCFWGPGEVPAEQAIEEMLVIRTRFVTLTLSDLPEVGGAMIEVLPPAVSTPLTLTLGAAGIQLQNGDASILLSPVSVSINEGALEVI